MLLTQRSSGIADNPLRNDLWRVGHAPADQVEARLAALDARARAMLD